MLLQKKRILHLDHTSLKTHHDQALQNFSNQHIQKAVRPRRFSLKEAMPNVVLSPKTGENERIAQNIQNRLDEQSKLVGTVLKPSAKRDSLASQVNRGISTMVTTNETFLDKQ